ncbi:MAG: hypothetical protein SLRJCFUN_000086 [Candidatus Fervidibacter sp.]
MFVTAVALTEPFHLDDLLRAEAHFLDAVLLPVHERNWRDVLSALNIADENGWALRFLLWAKGKGVKNVPLHRFAQHPKLLGWVVEHLDDPALLAMLRATTETGFTLTWQQPSPFTYGVLSAHPQRDGKWWAWLTVNEPTQFFSAAVNALLEGADSLCFAQLPNEEPADERERLKALASLSVQFRLWQPLLADRRESWEVLVDGARCRCWQLATDEWLTLIVPTGKTTTLVVPLPFRVAPGWRAYGLRFPALVRFPMQVKGETTQVKVIGTTMAELVWVTGDRERLERMHRRAGELLPKAMQFAVQWVLARKEQIGEVSSEISGRLWQMLQAAKRRQFSKGYLLAQQLLSDLVPFIPS